MTFQGDPHRALGIPPTASLERDQVRLPAARQAVPPRRGRRTRPAPVPRDPGGVRAARRRRGTAPAAGPDAEGRARRGQPAAGVVARGPQPGTGVARCVARQAVGERRDVDVERIRGRPVDARRRRRSEGPRLRGRRHLGRRGLHVDPIRPRDPSRAHPPRASSAPRDPGLHEATTRRPSCRSIPSGTAGRGTAQLRHVLDDQPARVRRPPQARPGVPRPGPQGRPRRAPRGGEPLPTTEPRTSPTSPSTRPGVELERIRRGDGPAPARPRPAGERTGGPAAGATTTSRRSTRPASASGTGRTQARPRASTDGAEPLPDLESMRAPVRAAAPARARARRGPPLAAGARARGLAADRVRDRHAHLDAHGLCGAVPVVPGADDDAPDRRPAARHRGPVPPAAGRRRRGVRGRRGARGRAARGGRALRGDRARVEGRRAGSRRVRRRRLSRRPRVGRERGVARARATGR